MTECIRHSHLAIAPSPSDFDQGTVQAFQALGRVFHLQRQAMHRRLGSLGTHHGELVTLRLLAASDGTSQRDLAETLHLSRPRITSILQELERAGAVSRQPDAEDQRVTRVFLTAEGRRRELEHRSAFEEYLTNTIGALSQADKMELARILDELSCHIAGLLCPGASGHEGQPTP